MFNCGGMLLPLTDYYPAIKSVFMHISVITYRNAYNNANKIVYTKTVFQIFFNKDDTLRRKVLRHYK